MFCSSIGIDLRVSGVSDLSEFGSRVTWLSSIGVPFSKDSNYSFICVTGDRSKSVSNIINSIYAGTIWMRACIFILFCQLLS